MTEIEILRHNLPKWRSALLNEAERFEKHAGHYRHDPEIAGQSLELARRCRLAAACFELPAEAREEVDRG